MLNATVEKEWAEVRRPGRGKVEDWTYVVTYSDGSYVLDVHCYREEADAKMRAALFEMGEYHLGNYDSVIINNVFEDMENVDVES